MSQIVDNGPPPLLDVRQIESPDFRANPIEGHLSPALAARWVNAVKRDLMGGLPRISDEESALFFEKFSCIWAYAVQTDIL